MKTLKLIFKTFITAIPLLLIYFVYIMFSVNTKKIAELEREKSKKEEEAKAIRFNRDQANDMEIQSRLTMDLANLNMEIEKTNLNLLDIKEKKAEYDKKNVNPDKLLNNIIKYINS